MIPNKLYIENLIRNKLLPITVEVRETLAQSYNVVDKDSSTYGYRGLCNVACAAIKEKIEEEFFESELDVVCRVVHGEQKHTPRIKSTFWPMQHTWLDVIIAKDVIYHVYIDPTCEQFRGLYNFSRAIYIETAKPKWYYDDKDNFLFTPIGKWVNDLIYINHKTFVEGKGKIDVKDGIVEFCQYEIWGRVSDLIRFIRNTRKRRQFKKQGLEYKEIGGSL